MDSSKHDPSGCALTLTDIKIKISGIVLYIRLRKSKTDQRVHKTDIVLQSGPIDQSCPVRYIRKYLVVQPNVDGSLLLHYDSTCLS